MPKRFYEILKLHCWNEVTEEMLELTIISPVTAPQSQNEWNCGPKGKGPMKNLYFNNKIFSGWQCTFKLAW